MHYRLAWWMLALLLLSGSAVADDAQTEQEHKIVRQIVINDAAESGKLSRAVSADRFREAGRRLKDAIMQLRESGDLTEAGMEKLQAVLDELANDACRLKVVEERVVVVNGGELPGGLDIDGLKGEAIRLKEIESDLALKSDELRKAYAVELQEGGEEQHRIVVELDDDGGDGIRVLKMETGEDGEWIVENDGFPAELVEKLKLKHGGDVGYEVTEDGANVFRLHKDGEEMVWLEGGHPAAQAADLHSAAFDEWFAGWQALIEELAVKLDAQDIDRIHEKLSWLKDHLGQTRESHHRVLRLNPDEHSSMFLSPEHHEKLMQLHELDGEWFNKLQNQEWSEQHQEMLHEHLQQLKGLETMQFDHDALLEEIEALVEELIEQRFAEMEQNSAQSV